MNAYLKVMATCWLVIKRAEIYEITFYQPGDNFINLNNIRLNTS